MRLQPGTSLQGGRYRIIDVLGQGGFGITYLAEQVMAERKVCIKEFFPKEYYNRDANLRSISLGTQGSAKIMERYKAKFVKEAQTIAHLDHPNIIHILDVFEENNTCYYAMDYIEGESLSERVKRGGAMSERDAVAYIKQVASALEHIHEQQIMHLDVKPGNIMVRTKDDRAILIDFGLSKHYDATSGEATSTTPVGVSHGYAPMEQYQDGGVSTFSPETDIYSLGATLYFLVTGNVPPQTTVVAEQGLPQLGALSSNIRETIERSMSYWRKDRPHTIKDFLALLDDEVPVVEVLVDEEEKTKIVPHTPAPKRESNEDKPKHKKSRWWLWSLLLLFIVVLLMSIKNLFSNGDNSKEVATKEKTVYIPTNVTVPAPDESEPVDAEVPAINQEGPEEVAPAAAPEATPEPTPEPSPEAAPVVAPKATTEVTPEPAPEAAPVAASKKAPKPTTTEESETSAPYKVGDYYNVNGKKGVVFEVRDNGRHGKIVSLDEAKLAWDSRVRCDANGILINGTKTGANNESDGKANTDKIMNRPDSEYFEACVWCRKKGSDWYLPAIEELKAISNNKSTINSTLAEYGGTKLSGWYWSSTEYSKFSAWFVSVDDGDTFGNIKYNNGYVRVVSAF